MLQWMRYSIHTNVVTNQKEWCEKIGFPVTNMHQVKSGLQGFTLPQIAKASKLITGNMNWLWGLETNMLRTSKPLSPLQLLRQATSAIETQLGLDRIIASAQNPNKKPINSNRKSKKQKV